MVGGYALMFRWSPVSPLVCQHSSPLKPVKLSVTTFNEVVCEVIRTATHWQLQKFSVR